MALGDVKSGISTLAAGTTNVYTIQPPTGEEWVIHNLYYSAGMEMSMTNGTLILPFDTDGSAGARLGAMFHLTNGYYMTIRNTSASASVIVSYDGIQTK